MDAVWPSDFELFLPYHPLSQARTNVFYVKYVASCRALRALSGRVRVLAVHCDLRMGAGGRGANGSLTGYHLGSRSTQLGPTDSRSHPFRSCLPKSPLPWRLSNRLHLVFPVL